MKAEELVNGEEYKFKHQQERLIYVGCNWSGNGYWHQFEKLSNRGVVWSELQGVDIELIGPSLKELSNES